MSRPFRAADPRARGGSTTPGSSPFGRPGQAPDAPVEVEVVLGRQLLVEAGVLEQRAGQLAHVGEPRSRHVVSEHARASRRGLEQTEQQPDGRGLAAAVRAEEAEHDAGRHRDVEAVEGAHRAEVAREVLRLDDVPVRSMTGARRSLQSLGEGLDDTFQVVAVATQGVAAGLGETAERERDLPAERLLDRHVAARFDARQAGHGSPGGVLACSKRNRIDQSAL